MRKKTGALISSRNCAKGGEIIRFTASVVQKTCATALSPKIIQKAVKRASVAGDRDRNLIIHGVDGEDLTAKVGNIFSQLGEKPLVTAPLRVGTVQSEKIIPVKISLSSQDSVYQLLKKSKNLKDVSNMSSV